VDKYFVNLFKNFKLFEEKTPYVDIVKKQLGVSKSLWLGMPVLISNVKLGKIKITKPTMFYVKDFNDNTVTMKSSLFPTSAEDSDDEIDVSGDDEQRDIIISRNDFYNIQEPQGMQAGGGAAPF
jgi:hypothetical protein